MAALAGKGEQVFMAVVRTADAGKPVMQVAAVKIAIAPPGGFRAVVRLQPSALRSCLQQSSGHSISGARAGICLICGLALPLARRIPGRL